MVKVPEVTTTSKMSNESESMTALYSNDSDANVTVDTPEQYVEFYIHELLSRYVPPVLLLAGTIGNLLSFCVLLRKSMRRISTYNYLCALAVLDTIVIYIGLLTKWLVELTDENIADFSDTACKVINVSVYTVTVSSVWLLIAVTVDRYIVTVHSLHAQLMCTTSRAVKVIALIVFLCVLIHLHFLWTMGISESDKCRVVDKFLYKIFVTQVWPWVDAALYTLLPFLIITTLNVSIIKEVARSHQQRRSLRLQNTAGDHATPPSSSHTASENHVRVTVMLLVVSFTFVVCTLPMPILMIYRSFLPKRSSMQLIARVVLANTVCELLMYTNHCINFYLYLITGHKFRQEMLQMLCQRKPQRVSRTSFSTTRMTTINRISLEQRSTGNGQTAGLLNRDSMV